MKPFNLEEAKAGKSIVTRDGLPVRIICFDAKICKSTPILALARSNLGHDIMLQITLDGSACYPCHDLFMKTEKKTGWIVVNPGYRKAMCSGNIYFSKQAAEEEAPKNCLIVPVEWEE